jgi:large subunit ribosomal protein L18
MSVSKLSVRQERRVNSMKRLVKKALNQRLRKARIRSTVSGTTERPRLSVFISNTQVSAQVIDDTKGTTLAASTTVGAKVEGSLSVKAAWVGADVAKKAKKAKVSKVVLDRNGRAYAGRLKALADAAREAGLEF